MLSCMIVQRHSQACVECVDLVSAAEMSIQMATGAIWGSELEPLRHPLSCVTLQILQTHASDFVPQLWHHAHVINLLWGWADCH